MNHAGLFLVGWRLAILVCLETLAIDVQMNLWLNYHHSKSIRVNYGNSIFCPIRVFSRH